MNYVEAFQKLGYTIVAPRSDWSAEKDGGVCITIWQKERSIKDGLPYLDLWELHPSGGEWQEKSGHKKRMRHLQKAMDQFDGAVDVIFVTGEPGESYESANPWIKEERGFGWRISKFDPDSGYFRAEIDKTETIG